MQKLIYQFFCDIIYKNLLLKYMIFPYKKCMCFAKKPIAQIQYLGIQSIDDFYNNDLDLFLGVNVTVVCQCGFCQAVQKVIENLTAYDSTFSDCGILLCITQCPEFATVNLNVWVLHTTCIQYTRDCPQDATIWNHSTSSLQNINFLSCFD